MYDARCMNCHGRLSLPGLHGCKWDRHAKPTVAQEIVWAVEKEMNQRRHIGWSQLGSDIQEDLRSKMTMIVEEILAKNT